MIYKLYLRTPFIPYLEENKYVRTSLDEIYEIIDNETEFTDYLLIGYDSDGVPHTQMGHIDITKNSTKVKKLTRK